MIRRFEPDAEGVAMVRAMQEALAPYVQACQAYYDAPEIRQKDYATREEFNAAYNANWDTLDDLIDARTEAHTRCRAGVFGVLLAYYDPHGRLSAHQRDIATNLMLTSSVGADMPDLVRKFEGRLRMLCDFASLDLEAC